MAHHRGALTRAVLGSVFLECACQEGAPAQPVSPMEPTPEECGGRPQAWVLAPDPAGARARLERAGFDVEPLPLDRSPWGLSGLLVLGSDASATPAYSEYMQLYADDLREFVAEANVVLQSRQSSASEPAPPFLPPPMAVRRTPAQIGEVHVLAPEHPLLALADLADEHLAWGEGGSDVFVEPQGFDVLLAGAEDGSHGVLLAGGVGRGRIVLSAAPIEDPPEVDASGEIVLDGLLAALAAELTTDCVPELAPPKTMPPPEPMPFAANSTVFAVLPDTQYYAVRYPSLFDVQTAWIADNAETLNIAYVFHLGDIVHNNTDTEWSRASRSMSILDGVVPYGLATGNHDYGPAGTASSRETGLHQWFLYDDAELMPSFGGAFEAGKLDNSYHLFEAGGHAWIALMLEWGPRDAVIAWADAVMAAHPDRLGILVTHAYLKHDDRRFDHTDTTVPFDYNPHDYGTPGGVNDGEELWQKLVRRHRFALVLSGHVTEDGTGHLVSVDDHGRRVHQMLSNYQQRELGGEGFMRLLELLPDGKTLVVRTYSPWLDQYLRAVDQSFTIELDVD